MKAVNELSTKLTSVQQNITELRSEMRGRMLEAVTSVTPTQRFTKIASVKEFLDMETKLVSPLPENITLKKALVSTEILQTNLFQ